MDVALVKYPETRTFDYFLKQCLKELPGLKCLELHGTVKIHGTNISLVFTALDTWRIQSRNRILSAQEDLFDCYATLNPLPLGDLAQQVLALSDESSKDWNDIMIVGEWAGRGIQKGVGVGSLSRFLTIFNIRIGENWQDIRKFRSVSLPQYRIFNICDFPTYSLTVDISNTANIERADKEMDELVKEIDKRCPIAAQLGVEGTGEGIVYAYCPPQPTGQLYNFKVKGPSHQIVRKERLSSKPSGLVDAIRAFIEYAVTEARLDQGMDYLKEMNIPVIQESIGKYIGWVVKDVLKEETDTMENMGLKEKDIRHELTNVVKQGWRKRLLAEQRHELEALLA